MNENENINENTNENTKELQFKPPKDLVNELGQVLCSRCKVKLARWRARIDDQELFACGACKWRVQHAAERGRRWYRVGGKWERQGMVFEKFKQDTRTEPRITVRLTRELEQKIERYRAHERLELSEAVRELIEKGLKGLGGPMSRK